MHMHSQKIHKVNIAYEFTHLIPSRHNSAQPSKYANDSMSEQPDTREYNSQAHTSNLKTIANKQDV